MKTIIALIVVVIALSSITLFARDTSREEITPVTKQQIEEPELPKVIENASQKLFKKQETVDSQAQSLTSAQLKKLAGDTNNEYHIRKDILNYIETIIPPDNKPAKDAILKFASSSQYMYFEANKEKALISHKTNAIALYCLSKSFPDWVQAARGINKLMRNTKERDQHLWDIDNNYFAWNVLGTGNSTPSELNQMCETGSY